MKKQIRKWTLRLIATGAFIALLLIIIILKPILTYAHETPYNSYNIFHNKPIDNALKTNLDEATILLQTSEVYDPNLKIDICLNDGSVYPTLMQKIHGQAFGWGFYNKVVLMGNAHYTNNYVELNGYKWNLTQLLAHEMTHCSQFRKFGLWKSNPIAHIPTWKWEGYPEYVARKNEGQKDLLRNIDRLIRTEQTGNNGWP